MSNTVKITIDDQQIDVQEGKTILDVCEDLGIKIPTLCYHKAILPFGACRLCLVEAGTEKQTKITASCTYPVWEGLVARTNTEKVLSRRRIMAELILARCSDSDPIKEMAAALGVTETRFPKRGEDCMLCELCTRVCSKLMKNGAIDFSGRGDKRKVGSAYDKHSSICMACGACQSVCPMNTIDLSKITRHVPKPIMSDYDMGLAPQSPIYIPFPQAIPKIATIDRNTCMHFLKHPQDACKACAEFCEAKAIDYSQKDEIEQINVGAVVLAPGYEQFDPCLKKELGYDRFPNVISSLQFERILSSSGPYQGQVLRPSDQEHPRKIAWIQCVGSREVATNYCSSVCCMYATKEAIIGKEHEPDLDCTIFYIDMRAFGKGFDAYYNRAKELGVKYVRCRPSSIKEVSKTKNLKITYQSEDDKSVTDEFDMVVLSTGMRPPAEVQDLGNKFGVDLNQHGFATTHGFTPVDTSNPGVYVCGPFSGPKDIPETVTEASASASQAMALLTGARGTLIIEKEYPPEKDVSGQEARIGVFVCHCGKNIGGVADVPAVAEYARTLANVVYVEDNMYTCSTDTQEKIKEMIKVYDLNRVIVASCSPRTHEPVFRNTCREAGLNEYLFEMANIRDQCTWVHMHMPEKATEKAKHLVRMAIAKARLLEPLYKGSVKVNHEALVLGGGMAGMTAALNLADQGFQVHLVEKEKELGGNFRQIYSLLGGENPQERLNQAIEKVKSHSLVQLYLESMVSAVEGSVGNFESTIARNGEKMQIPHGIAIVATGAVEHKPTEYLYGEDDRIITQSALEKWIAEKKPELEKLKSVVMIQCVGSREEKRPYCSRVCCSQAVKNAMALKTASPEVEVYVLYRDMRTYGFREEYYRKARDMGVRFIRYKEDKKPEVSVDNGILSISCVDPILKVAIRVNCDALVLAPAIVPYENAEVVGKLFKVPLNQDRFFLEAHMKLRPIDFATDGVFMCGLTHSPKSVEESIAQAGAAAAKAAIILSSEKIEPEAAISEVVDKNCDGCAYCIDPCPYGALTLIEYMRNGAIKKTVERNEVLCKGCGVCMATCPKQGIFVRHFKVEQINAMVEAALEME